MLIKTLSIKHAILAVLVVSGAFIGMGYEAFNIVLGLAVFFALLGGLV